MIFKLINDHNILQIINTNIYYYFFSKFAKNKKTKTTTNRHTKHSNNKMFKSRTVNYNNCKEIYDHGTRSVKTFITGKLYIQTVNTNSYTHSLTHTDTIKL